MDGVRSLISSQLYGLWLCLQIYFKDRKYFLRDGNQHSTRETINKFLNSPHTYSTQTIWYITYPDPRILNTVILYMRSCERSFTFSYREEAHIFVQ